MSRCPKLDYESVSFFGNSDDKYIYLQGDRCKNGCRFRQGRTFMQG